MIPDPNLKSIGKSTRAEGYLKATFLQTMQNTVGSWLAGVVALSILGDCMIKQCVCLEIEGTVDFIWWCGLLEDEKVALGNLVLT